MSEGKIEVQRLLLIDTCGDVAQVALSRGSLLERSEALTGRASVGIVAAVKQLLRQQGLRLADLDGVGVVSGPGSFTGVRTGLASAKGLCEAAGLPLAAVSRLEMLATAAELKAGFAVLDADRDAFYVREVRREQRREWLATLADLEAARAEGDEIVVAGSKTAERLAAFDPRTVELRLHHMLPIAHRVLAEGGTDIRWADANYVRAENDIYERPRPPGERAGLLR